ncbi:MAG: hypothetical protein GXP32_01215, partial [Kiritimatiellaeota bacterium]|nr:hypothetical protein [Kiritimatiellota bacterium]
MIETSPLLRAMLSKTAFLTACGNWELPSPLGDTEPPRRNFFADEVSHQKRGAAKMIHYIVSYLKNSRVVWNIHLVAFFCVCFATPFIVFAERGSFHDDERTVLLPPLRKTLSTDGKTKARALALFAKGCGEMRKKRLLTPKAEKAFLDALRLNPELKGPLQILLKEWTRGRKPKLLLEKLLPIAKQHPDAVNLNLVVASTMRILGKSDDALNLLENTFTALFTDAPKKEVSPELKTKLVFNLLDLTAEKKLWNKGEETLETVFSSPKLSKNLIARIAAAKFFAKCADVGPDGFFAGWSKRRRKRLLKKNLAIIEKLCSTENVPAPTLLAICKIYKRYSMRGRAEQLLLTQLLNNPNSPSSMLVLAKVFDANKDYANEMRAWKIMINSKKYADIKKAWSKTHPTKASSTELYFQLGLAAIKANDWSEALAAFDWRLLNAPDDVATIFQLGLVQMRMGKFRKALYHFDKLDKLPFALYFAALCHRALEEYELSFEAISESERLAKELKFNT